MRSAHDAAVRVGDGKNRKLQIAGLTPFWILKKNWRPRRINENF
jgi:hypothetical protein